MASDTPSAAPDDADPLLRPAWEDTPDETDADLGPRPRGPADAPPNARSGAWPDDDLRRLLGPLCDATDALARLDARAAAAPDGIREGLIARRAFAEAAGWLAHAHAWVHPLDLALRELSLTGPTALAATGAGPRVLPQTFAVAGRAAWDDPPFDAMAEGDRAVAEALALARVLRRLAGPAAANPFASATRAAETLTALGGGWLDPDRFAAWWQTVAPQPVRRHRYGMWKGQGGEPPLPALLIAAHAARNWMEAGIATTPTPLQAILMAVGVLVRAGLTRTVFVPVWSAYPAVGFGERDHLPTLRSDAADRLVGRGQSVTWPLAFLHLVAESARAAARALDRLEAAAAKGRGLVAERDQRSRLPAAVDALLRVPVLTPKALAARLKIAPQTATALLRALQAAGLVREVTGRGSFRAFSV